jgi:3-oxoacyl-[acyl-carrier protein] reductase
MKKTAIVTGSSRGIGKHIALSLAEIGYNLVINYSRSADAANQVVSEIKELGGNAIALQADLQTSEGATTLFNAALSEFERVEVLVNNAGVMITKPLAEMTEKDFDTQMLTNVKGTFFMLKEAIVKLSPGGSIINMSSSVLGQMFPGYSVYAGAKGAVEQFTRQLAKEFGAKNITINAIAPGPVGTELFLQGKSQAQVESLAAMNAFHRLGEPVDIARVVELLSDDRFKWVTGQTLRVNGGFI